MFDPMAFYLAHPFWVWGALAAAILTIEVMTGSGWLLWPSAAAAVVAFLSTFGGLDGGQSVLVFSLLTISLTLLARRYMPKSLFRHAGLDINDAAGRLVGHQGRVVIAFQERNGRVFVDGKEWAADADDGTPLKAGSRIEVTGVAGARLRVKAA